MDKYIHEIHPIMKWFTIKRTNDLMPRTFGTWFYGELVYKLKKIVGSNNFSAQFIKIVPHYKKIGYNINVLQQTACLVVNPITVGHFAFLFNCIPVGRTSDSITVLT